MIFLLFRQLHDEKKSILGNVSVIMGLKFGNGFIHGKLGKMVLTS